MLQEVIPYLSMNKGARLENVLPNIKLMNDTYRFDSHRFDILAVHKSEDIFFGIRTLKPGANYRDLQRIVDDAKWFNKYNGTSIILIPQDRTEYWNIFDEEKNTGFLMPKYYSQYKGEYTFVDDPRVQSQQSPVAVRQVVHHDDRNTSEKKSEPPYKIEWIPKNVDHRSDWVDLAFTAYNIFLKLRK